jgi:hypothetical protein
VHPPGTAPGAQTSRSVPFVAAAKGENAEPAWRIPKNEIPGIYRFEWERVLTHFALSPSFQITGIVLPLEDRVSNRFTIALPRQ